MTKSQIENGDYGMLYSVALLVEETRIPIENRRSFASIKHLNFQIFSIVCVSFAWKCRDSLKPVNTRTFQLFFYLYWFY